MEQPDEEHTDDHPAARDWHANEMFAGEVIELPTEAVAGETPQELSAGETELAVDGRPVYQIDKTSPQALVIHCGDSRFQIAFRRFVTEELGITSYAQVIIGGGVHAFGVQSFLPKNYKILWEQVKFFLKEQKLRQVIIINHEDCKWYAKMQGYDPKIKLPLKGKIDLQTAARTILQDFAGVQVRTFWAGLDGDRVSFTEVT